MKKLLFLAGLICFALLLQGCSTTTVTLADGSQEEVSGRLVDLGNGICQDVLTGQMWQQTRSKRLHSIDDAKDYVNTIELGGYDDWRLPTVAELYDLHLFFDIHENGTCQIKTKGNYWSDEPDAEGRVGSWEMDENCDPERQYIPKQAGRVRVVRDVVK